jgi:hypothetical protein
MTESYTHRIEIFTASLLITGDYELPIYRRVSDAFNGEQRRYIPLQNATIAPLVRAQQPQPAPSLLLDRTEALLVATIAEATPPEDYQREEQLRGVVPITAMFFTEAFVVRGTFHRRPNQTLTEAFERFTEDFLPLSHVQIYPLSAGFTPITRDFAALSRSRIVALYHLREQPAAAAPPEPPAPAEAPPAEAVAPDTTEAPPK